MRLLFFLFFAILIFGTCAKNERNFSQENNDVQTNEGTAKMEAEGKTSTDLRSKGLSSTTEPRDLQDLLSYTQTHSAVTDTMPYLLRTADIKFMTQSVFLANLGIEQATQALGGYVQDSKLNSQIYQDQEFDISTDSLVRIQRYKVESNLVLRVPARNFDELIKKLVPHIHYLNYRNIAIQDIELHQVSKQLAIKRLAKYEQQMSAVANSGKLPDVVDAHQQILQKQEQADENQIEQLSLQKQILMSTISLTIYQNENVVYTRFARSDLKQFQPSFFDKVFLAAKSGLTTLENLVIWLIELWWLFGIVTLIVASYRFYKRCRN